MYQYVVGAAAGYVLGTKAGRKRYHQIVNAAQAVANSPVTKQVTSSARRAIAKKIDPEPRMREVKDLRKEKAAWRFGQADRGHDLRAGPGLGQPGDDPVEDVLFADDEASGTGFALEGIHELLHHCGAGADHIGAAGVDHRVLTALPRGLGA